MWTWRPGIILQFLAANKERSHDHHVLRRDCIYAMTAAVIAAGILGAAGAVHVYWAAGGRVGVNAALRQVAGKRLFTPGKLATLGVALGLFAVAALALWRDGLIALPLPFVFARYGAPLIALVFFARAVGDFRHIGWSKRLRGSRFARLDDVLYVPLCLTLAICFASVSLF